MFTEEELEGCPSVQFEEWANTNEADIRAACRVIDVDSYARRDKIEHYEDQDKLSHILELLMQCWDAKKCPYG